MGRSILVIGSVDAVSGSAVRVRSRTIFLTLSIRSLRPGDGARITGLAEGDRAYRQRLLAMGPPPGVVFSPKRTDPLGGPIEIDVRDFTPTLRRGEAGPPRTLACVPEPRR